MWYATQRCRLKTAGASHLVADVLMGEVPHVVPLHVLIPQPTSHDQPSSTASAHIHTCSDIISTWHVKCQVIVSGSVSR